MSLLKEIGAILGFVAFGGMAVLAFLTFQQARYIRRLREWAGRSPERAAVEAERVAGAAGEATLARGGAQPPPAPSVAEPKGPGRMTRLRGELAYRWEELDRRSPADPKILIIGLLAVLIGVAVATSGFGLLGGGSAEPAPSTTTAAGTGEGNATKPKVAILNGTATEVGGVGVDGVADAAKPLVTDAGFSVGATDNGPPTPASVVMFAEGSKSEARDLASSLEPALGPTEVELITPEVGDLAGGAQLVLIIGQDDGATL